MPNKRHPNKVSRCAWLTPAQWESIKIISSELGTDITGLLRMIAEGDVTITRSDITKTNSPTED